MLERYSWTEARELYRHTNVALIPVGSTEQHGPHLPLGTDYLAARALAESAAKEAGILCTPVIPVGISQAHLQFWGTLTVSPDAFRAYMRDLALSLASHGPKRLIFVNGHGGNGAALQEICRDLRTQGIFALLWQWWLDPQVLKTFERLFQSRGTHAGAGETSIIWAIDESLVDQKALQEATRGASETFGVVRHGAQLPYDTADFSTSGATLDPREASRQAGEEILRTAQAELLQLIRWLAAAADEELQRKPHMP
jgi:creatinine amidohydrolase